MSEFIFPTEQLSAQAAESLRSLSQVLGSGQLDSYTLRLEHAPDHPVVLPAPALQIVRALLAELANGNAVSLVTHPAELTMQEAAEILEIQGPLLVSLIENGKLPYHRKVGSRPVLRLTDVIQYKRDREVETRELAALSAEMKADGGGWP